MIIIIIIVQAHTEWMKYNSWIPSKGLIIWTDYLQLNLIGEENITKKKKWRYNVLYNTYVDPCHLIGGLLVTWYSIDGILHGRAFLVILDSLDRYRDVIGTELVTWYQLRGSKLLYFPGRSLFGVILTGRWNEYIFNQCMSPSWGLYVTNYTRYTITEGHLIFSIFFFHEIFFPLKLFFPHFLFFPKNAFLGNFFFRFFFPPPPPPPKFVYNFFFFVRFFFFLELSRQIIFP